METTEITFIVSKKTKSAFELALYFSDKDKNEVFELLVKEYAAKVLKEYGAESCEPPLESDFVVDSKNVNENKSKALAKIPVWATNRKGQIGAQIVKAFFLCESNGVASRNAMREVFLKNNPDKTAWSFDGNLASMCTEKGNSHGLFFVVSGDNVCASGNIENTLFSYRDEFLEKQKEEPSMGYKLCPICQLNMIEEDEEKCNVCGGGVQESYSHPHASATIDSHYLLKSFYSYCKTPGIDSGKAQSYVNAIQYLCDFLSVHQINEQIVAKFKSLEIEIARSNNATRIKLLNFLERRRQSSYLTGGFMRAALRYFYPFWEQYKNKNF